MGSYLDPNNLTLIVFLKDYFKLSILERVARQQKIWFFWVSKIYALLLETNHSFVLKSFAPQPMMFYIYDVFQNELLLALEAEKNSQRADLEDHIKTAQNSVDEKKEEISKLQKQLEQVLPYFWSSFSYCLEPKAVKIEPLQRHYIVSLSKILYPPHYNMTEKLLTGTLKHKLKTA